MSSPPYAFLTDAWIDAAHALRAEFADRIPPPPAPIRMNVVVTKSPHHDEPIQGHIDTSAGEIIIERGHIDRPDLTITVDYQTATAAFVSRDPQAVMASFLGGKILVEGDVMKLMVLQGQEPTEDVIEMYLRLDALTARD